MDATFTREEFEYAGNLWVLKIEATANVLPGEPRTHDYPGSLTTIEDIEVRVTGASVYDEYGFVGVASPGECARLTIAYSRFVDTHAIERERIEERLYAAVG